MTHPGKEALTKLVEDTNPRLQKKVAKQKDRINEIEVALILWKKVASQNESRAQKAEARAERVERERDEAREALKRMENCFDELAATRSHEIYIAMIDGGQAQALLDLDVARRNARAILAKEPTE